MQEFTTKLTECLSCHWLHEIRTTDIHVNTSQLLQVIWAMMLQIFLNNQILSKVEKDNMPFRKDQGLVHPLELYDL